MTKFLVTVGVMLGAVLVVVVIAFVYVQLMVSSGVKRQPSQQNSAPEAAGAAADPQAKTLVDERSETATPVQVPAGIPLRTLPLSAAQQTLLTAAGIDYETFIITPDMIACAKLKLGEERFVAVVGGSAPTTLETMSLLRCL